VITANINEPARTGTFKRWLGGYEETHTDSLAQQITLPSTATAITLEFFLHISTEEQTLQEFDRLRVRLRRPNGQIARTLRTYSNLQAAPGFGRQTFDLTDFRGQTLRIELVATEIAIDDVARRRRLSIGRRVELRRRGGRPAGLTQIVRVPFIGGKRWAQFKWLRLPPVLSPAS
jgi:hypothetical protein